MPLIDDDTLRTDRRTRSWWPWVLVAAGMALLWLIFAVAITFIPRAMSSNAAVIAPTAPMQAHQSSLIQQSAQMMSFGSPQQALTLLSGINPNVPMSLSDKHTYFRVYAQALEKTGSPMAASRYYDRFLTLGVSIHSEECRSCHNTTTGIAPVRLRDLLQSELGKSYALALVSAGKVKAIRAELQAQFEEDPEDLRAHLLLYHLAAAREEKAEAAKHAKLIRKIDEEEEAKARASQGQ